ncbi:hypothetical protein EVAR_88924_1 [Eumeta japonica]|uniref:Uncharacterized protein n=1 Tax=Eumeta variegata TaxID=151549 RepID=A0A4C1VQC7_EUMVA|nr:hypothetical protein EVAR_88924_1 [Eumeta japonica]
MRYMPPAPIRSLISRSELRLDRTKNHMPIRGDTLCCQMCLLKYAIRSRTAVFPQEEGARNLKPRTDTSRRASCAPHNARLDMSVPDLLAPRHV